MAGYTARLALAALNEAVAECGETLKPGLGREIMMLLGLPEEERLAVGGLVAALANTVRGLGPVMAFEVLLAIERLNRRRGGAR